MSIFFEGLIAFVHSFSLIHPSPSNIHDVTSYRTVKNSVEKLLYRYKGSSTYQKETAAMGAGGGGLMVLFKRDYE